MTIPYEIVYSILEFIPETDIALVEETVREKPLLLSNRRNKGLLTIDPEIVNREVNLEFFNSGFNDGLPSWVIRESVILRSTLANHPNIVGIEEVCCPTLNVVRVTYPAYRYTLRDVMGKGPCENSLLHEISLQIFRGLSYMHAHDVVHRNLRPENILVETGGSLPLRVGEFVVKISDFAQSRILGVSDVRHPLTPEESKNRQQTERERQRLLYKAPERLERRRSYGCAVDVWAIGVILLELVGVSVPWSPSTSETECLFRISLTIGMTPRVECGGVWNWTLPVSNGDAWSNLINNVCMQFGESFGKLVRGILRVSPEERLTADACVKSEFIQGHAFSGVGQEGKNRPEVHSHISPHPKVSPVQDLRLEWIGGWLMKVAKVIECPSSRPVHVAVALFSHLWNGNHGVPPTNLAATLVACLKLATRFQTSKDMFKQVSGIDIATACSDAVAVGDILEAEMQCLQDDSALSILNSPVCTSVGYIQLLLSALDPDQANLLYLSQYIADLSLLDTMVSNQHSPLEIAIASIVVAHQWSGSVDSFSFPHRTASVIPNTRVSVDAVQVAVSKCISLITERRGAILAFQNGVVGKVIESWYRIPGISFPVPKCFPSQWIVSRVYVANVLHSLQPVATGDSTVSASTALPASMATPSKPLYRSSTLQHANEWMIESRRRARTSVGSAIKRSRSATPLVKRQRCFVVDENEPPGTDSNILPSTSTGSVKESLETPRRSRRLADRVVATDTKNIQT